MTDREWLTSDDPVAMLKRVTDDRKVRLFAVACCRQVWSRLAHERTRRAVSIVEQAADGVLSVDAEHMGYRSSSGYADVRFLAYWITASVQMSSHHSLHRILNHVGCSYAAQADLLRCIATKPVLESGAAEEYRRPRWICSTAVRLASAMYTSRDFSLLPLLGDALEEAGCTDKAVLAHCRAYVASECGGRRFQDPAVHARGCWVVDMVRGL